MHDSQSTPGRPRAGISCSGVPKSPDVRAIALVKTRHSLSAFPDAIVDDQARFSGKEEIVNLATILLAPPFGPFTVEPQYLGVAGVQQFSELGFHVVEVLLSPARFDERGVVSFRSSFLRRMMPIHDRVVDAEFDSLGAAGGGEGHDPSRRHGVASTTSHCVACVSNRQKPSWCLEVMTTYLTPAFLASRPLGRIVRRRIELFGQLLVLGNGDIGVVHDPLADLRDFFSLPLPSWNRVQSPVDEHSKPRCAPPLHAGRRGRRDFRREAATRTIKRTAPWQAPIVRASSLTILHRTVAAEESSRFDDGLPSKPQLADHHTSYSSSKIHCRRKVRIHNLWYDQRKRDFTD